MKNFFVQMFKKTHIVRRIVMCVIAVCIMGFCVYWLDRLAWGTDPYSVTNLALSSKVGLSLGTTQAIVNILLLIIVFLKDRNEIGPGTVFNMFLVGYSYNLTGFVMDKLNVDYHFPKLSFDSAFNMGDFVWNVLWMIVLLFVFVVAVSVYMSVELGSAPYDAMSRIVHKMQKKLSFKVVRICWDGAFALIGFLLGGTVGIVTVLMACAIGPMIYAVEKRIKRFL